MRLNLFFGIRSSSHIVRDLIRHDPRISLPALALFRIEPDTSVRESLNDAVVRTGVTDAILRTMFEDLTKQEANLGNEQVDYETVVTVFLKGAKPGTRFIFWKPNDIDWFVKEHVEWVKEFERDKFLMFRRNFGLPTLDLVPLKKRVTYNFSKLDELASKVGAGDWKPFNLGEYFGDGVDAPTNLIIREYIKP